MARANASELREALRAGLAASLVPDGWREMGGERSLAVFVRPVEAAFFATVEVESASGSRERLPLVVSFVHVGVGYEPLQKLAPLLGMFDLDVKSAIVWPSALAGDTDEETDEDWSEDAEFDEGEDFDDDCEDEPDGEESGPQTGELRTPDDARELASELAAVVQERAVAYARRYASLDLLVARVRGPRSGSVTRPALLAAAGRFEEAKALLAQLPPPPARFEWMADQSRAARQLERWIDSGGDPAMIPPEPPPSSFPRSQSPSWSSVWQRSSAPSAALDAVKRDSQSKDRDELRAMLERELEQRGVSQSPLWFEQTLDHINDTPAERGELLIKGLISAGKLGIKAIRGIREGRPLPDLSVPDWLRPPDRAAWPVARDPDGDWVEVQVPASGTAWLDRAYQAIPRLFGSTASLDAWLDWDEHDEQVLAVHIGEQPVGTLAEAATSAYRPIMRAAGERDESPRAPARLTPRQAPGGYLLELQLPG